SAERRVPSVATAASAAKVAKPPQNLERLLFRLEECRCVGADAAQRVRPLGAGWAHRMESEGRRIEEDPLALDLLDHGPFGEHVLGRLSAGQATETEVEVTYVRERVVFVV